MCNEILRLINSEVSSIIRPRIAIFFQLNYLPQVRYSPVPWHRKTSCSTRNEMRSWWCRSKNCGSKGPRLSFWPVRLCAMISTGPESSRSGGTRVTCTFSGRIPCPWSGLVRSPIPPQSCIFSFMSMTSSRSVGYTAETQLAPDSRPCIWEQCHHLTTWSACIFTSFCQLLSKLATAQYCPDRTQCHPLCLSLCNTCDPRSQSKCSQLPPQILRLKLPLWKPPDSILHWCNLESR